MAADGLSRSLTATRGARSFRRVDGCLKGPPDRDPLPFGDEGEVDGCGRSRRGGPPASPIAGNQ